MSGQSEYAKAGVDYAKIEPFKRCMIGVVKATRDFPNARNVKVERNLAHAHGGVYHYTGIFDHLWCTTQEGLGNKSWATQLLYEIDKSAVRYYADAMYCSTMMIVNDCAAQGALPVIYTDEVAASSDSFFADDNMELGLKVGYTTPDQRFEIAAVDPKGRVFAAWLDKRNGPAARAAGKPYPGAALAYAWEDGTAWPEAAIAFASHVNCVSSRLMTYW